MKYFLIEIATGDAKISGKAIYEYNTLNEAIASFHQKMATAMKSDLYETEQLMIINSVNGVYEKYSDKFVREAAPEEVE